MIWKWSWEKHGRRQPWGVCPPLSAENWRICDRVRIKRLASDVPLTSLSTISWQSAVWEIKNSRGVGISEKKWYIINSAKLELLGTGKCSTCAKILTTRSECQFVNPFLGLRSKHNGNSSLTEPSYAEFTVFSNILSSVQGPSCRYWELLLLAFPEETSCRKVVGYCFHQRVKSYSNW